MKLIVRNLSRSVTEAQLKEMFSEFGHVQSCNLVLDNMTGASKGFGFVEIPKPGEAKAAMKNLNGQVMDGSRIRVKHAESKPDTSHAAEASTDTPEAPKKTKKTESNSNGNNSDRTLSNSEPSLKTSTHSRTAKNVWKKP